MVVTANERLAGAIVDAYDAHQVQRGIVSGPSARVSTLRAYLRSRHVTLRDAARTHTVLLTDDTQRLAWLEHPPHNNDTDSDGLYPQIADAWRLVHDWELAEKLGWIGDNENQRLFRDWADVYTRAAKSHRWITEPELAKLLATAVLNDELPAEPLLLLGFDVVTPSFARLIDAYRNAGVDVQFRSAETSPGASVETVSCEDSAQELRAASYWARDILRSSKQPVAIGIALPNLIDRHDQVVNQLDAILRPGDFDPDPSLSPYNISGGIAVSTVPVVAVAFDLLRWLHEPQHYTRVEALLRSPFISVDVDPCRSRDSGLPETYSAARFADFVSAESLRNIVSRTKQLGLMRLDTAIVEIRQLLEMAGWPDATHLSSESYQAHRAFLRLLDELSASAALLRPRDFAATVAQIRREAEHRLFAPERPAAPLQVLGYLETVGLEFTHLWVAGLNESAWPGPADPNPFVPMGLLRAASVTRADADGELVFSRRLTQHWRCASPTVVFSYARTHDDHPCRPSQLVSTVTVAAEEVFGVLALRSSHPYLKNTCGQHLEQRNDSGVGEVAVGALRHRGSAVLRDQSACPFRAFARYRLHAMQETLPHSFPDASERGVATHAALRTIFDRAGPDIDFARIDTGVIDAAVAMAFANYRRFPAAFRSSERNRLRDVVVEWLRLESTRPAFRVFATEHETVLSLNGMNFDLRIDRIDAVEPDGALLVIDYKTGAATANSVIGERPVEPQLAMYALSLAGVAAIAFAQVRSGECRLVGWADGVRADTFGVGRVRLNPAPIEHGGSWAALVRAWRVDLTRLADEFRGGVVDVRPRDALACRECDLHALCRIREMRRLVAA